MKTPECVDPDIGGTIAMEVAFPIAAGRAVRPENPQERPKFSEKVENHLRICECCREDLEKNLALWYKMGESAYETSLAFDMLNRSEGGDDSILRKWISSGLALFEPYSPESSRGLYVLVTRKWVFDPEEKTLEEFHQLK
jgi:hypothetical protein